jgi:prephenate dehydrogenase
MQRIAILGPGLLGGSLALKLRALGGAHVSLWARRAEAIAEIEARGCADAAGTEARAIVREAEVVVLCVPVEAMPALAREIAPALKPGAVVTDVGSVKAGVVAQLSEIFRGAAQFVGSHPMAGTEHTGLKAARAELFAGATCIVTPDAQTDARALAAVIAFWKKVGCRVAQLPAREHDECVALISHLPHLVAGALIHTVARKNAHAFGVVGPGFRDSTRVASGPPEMWVGILRENRAAVTAAVEAMLTTLTNLREALADPAAGDEQLRAFLAGAKATRDQISFPQ